MSKLFDPNHIPKEKPEQTEEQIVDRLVGAMENLADVIQEFTTDMNTYLPVITEHLEKLNKPIMKIERD